jgi:hypothetical protein
MAVQSLRDSAIEFCERTNVVQKWLDAVTLVEDQAEYEIDGDTQQDVAQIMAVTVDGSPIGATANVNVDRILADSATPFGVHADSPDGVLRIVIDPPPDAQAAGRSLRMKVSLRPTRSATQVQDILRNNWVEAIAAGALLRLQSTPGQTYTDLRNASIQQGKFEQAIARARIESNRGRIAADLRVTPRPFV